MFSVTHLAVEPVFSSFSEDEDVDEVMKKAGSVWLELPPWAESMGDNLSVERRVLLPVIRNVAVAVLF